MPKIFLNTEFGGNYEYEIPPIPKDKTKILFHDRAKENQFWDYKLPNISKWEEFEKQEFINEERRRFFEGIFFYNNGVVTYITGMHYFHLVNSTFKFGKAKYYDCQRLDFYFRDYCDKDHLCKGMLWLKPRRAGITAEEITACQYYAIRKKDQEVGLQSNTIDKCYTTLHRPIIDSILKLPYWVKPKFRSSNGKIPRNSAIEFSPDTLDELDEGGWLGGSIIPYPTTVPAMDGTKKSYIVGDEFWKLEKISPEQTIEVNLKCLPYGEGKMSVLSTMGDSQNVKQAVSEGINMWHLSNPKIRNKNGFTQSGLYRYFISAIHNKEEIPKEYTDKYGFVDEDKATKFLLADREKFDKNSMKYFYALRKNPLHPQEALSTAETSKIFSTGSINKQLDNLRSLPIDQQPFVKGNLVEDSSGRVSFIQDDSGIWEVYLLPDTDKRTGVPQDLSNRCTFRNGMWFPPNQVEFGCGYDPHRTGDASKGGRSTAAIIVGKKYDLFGNGNAGELAALMDYRFEDPTDGHREAFKACKFWGMQCTHERNVDTVQPHFVSNGAIELLRTHNDPKFRGLWVHGNGKIVSNGLNYIQGRLKKDPTTDIDPYSLIKNQELLMELSDFDPANTTKFNKTMALIMMEYELSKMLPTNKIDNDSLFNNFTNYF
jgi:hypothetical protein